MDIGHFYFLKKEYFLDFPNSNFMNDHANDEQEHKRPCFCPFTEDGIIYWLIPISSKVDKFEKIYQEKKRRYGKCDTIDFCNVLGHKKAVLIQNMCPVSKNYISNEYLDAWQNPVQICQKTRRRIIRKAKKILHLQRNGHDLVFGNVLEIEKQLLRHLLN